MRSPAANGGLALPADICGITGRSLGQGRGVGGTNANGGEIADVTFHQSITGSDRQPFFLTVGQLQLAGRSAVGSSPEPRRAICCRRVPVETQVLAFRVRNRSICTILAADRQVVDPGRGAGRRAADFARLVGHSHAVGDGGENDGEDQVHDHAGRDDRHPLRHRLGRIAARIQLVFLVGAPAPLAAVTRAAGSRRRRSSRPECVRLPSGR